MNTANIVLLVVQTLATLGALFFAWRTVLAAGKADEERRRDRLAARLDVLVETVSDIRLSNRNANRVESERYQDRLRPLLAAFPLPVAATRELAERRFTGDGYAEDEKLATRALEELRAEATRLWKHGLGH